MKVKTKAILKVDVAFQEGKTREQILKEKEAKLNEQNK
jgi:hypothetical protein